MVSALTNLDPIAFFTFAVIFCVVIVLVIFGLMAESKRRKALSEWAAAHQLVFLADNDSGFENRYPGFACFRQGSNRYAFNRMQGHWGQRPFTGFDYHYQITSHGSKGSRTRHYYFSGVILNSGIPLKPLSIRPENFFDKVTEFFGYDDIDFESAEFSRRFYVKAADKKWAYDVIHPRTMEFLMVAPEFTLQFDASYVLAWKALRFEPEEFAQAADVIAGILDRLPEYVIDQQKTSS